MYAWNLLPNTQAPIKCMPGTIWETHRHRSNVCLEPFDKHTSTIDLLCEHHFQRIHCLIASGHLSWTVILPLTLVSGMCREKIRQASSLSYGGLPHRVPAAVFLVSKHEQEAGLPHLIGAPTCVNGREDVSMAPQQAPRRALLRAPTGPPCILSRCQPDLPQSLCVKKNH
jgi:hypothetical protein